MNDGAPNPPLTSQEMSRVVALSASIAGGVLFLYIVDQLTIGSFDPLFRYMRFKMETDPRFAAADKYVSLALVGIWGVSWMLAGIDSIRSQGSRRLAVAAVGILIFGIIVALMMNSMVRGFTLRGVGVSP